MNKEELQKLMNVDTTMIQYKLLVAIKEVELSRNVQSENTQNPG